MALSSDIISQFVKATKDPPTPKKEAIVYGKVEEFADDGSPIVQLDGSEGVSTPTSTTVKVEAGDRVIVMIKNHQAVITGNQTSQAGSDKDISDIKDSLGEVVVADLVTTKQLNSEIANINRLKANQSVVDTLSAGLAEIKDLNVDSAYIKSLDTRYANFERVEAVSQTVTALSSSYATFEQAIAKQIEAVNAEFDTLVTKYATIDFSNIGNAAIEYFFARSGLIENVTVGDGTITGILVGVTIKGDTIEGNTIVADKLVMKGEDGLYYKLNTDGMSVDAEQTEYNSLNGSVIMAKSITATKVCVDDLVAFDATIGGFTITESSIHSEVKDSVENTTRGIYMNVDGEFNFGDENNFIKYYRDADGSYKLAISADSILYDLNGKPHSIADLGQLGEYVHIGTYEGEPCIELGERDSDFKLRITNTRMIFAEGTSVLAYFNNQSLHIKKAVVEEELQQGGFMWKVRSNGNLGLVWKGGL